MKNKRITLKKLGVLRANPIIWGCFVAYIVMSIVVTQMFNLEASRLSGILMLIPVMAMLAVKVVMSGGRIVFRLGYYHVYILLFGVFCLLSGLWAKDPGLAKSKGIDIIETFVIMCAVSICFRQRDSVEPLMKAIMVGYYIVVLYEVLFYGWDYFVTVMQDSTRVTSENVNSNTLGMCATIAIFINVYLLSEKKVPLWSIALMVPCFIVVVASGSRKALVSVFMAVLLYYLFHTARKKGRGLNVLRFLLVLPVAVFVVYQLLQMPIFAGVMERMEGLMSVVTGGKVEKSAMVRMNLTELGIKLFRMNPLLGVGIDNPRLFTFRVVGDTFYLHNNYVELLAGGGIVGFVLYYWIYARLLVTFIWRRNPDDRLYCACLALFIVLMVMDYGMVSYYDKMTYVYLYLFVGCASRLKAGRRG